MTTIKTVIYNSPNDPISHTCTTEQEIIVTFGHNEPFNSSAVFLYVNIGGSFSSKQLSNTKLLLIHQLRDIGVNVESVSGGWFQYTITATTDSLSILRNFIKLKNFYEGDAINY